MTKSSILTEIYQSKEVEAMIRSIKPKGLQDDIKQHCFLELFEKPEEFILDLYNRGKLRHYIVKVLYNTSRWSCTNLHKQLGKETPTEIFEDSPTDEYEEINIEPVIYVFFKLIVCIGNHYRVKGIFILQINQRRYYQLNKPLIIFI